MIDRVMEQTTELFTPVRRKEASRKLLCASGAHKSETQTAPQGLGLTLEVFRSLLELSVLIDS